MVYIADHSPKPVGFHMMSDSSLGATCPTCSLNMLTQDGLTRQEAHHVLSGEVYEIVSFWPVRVRDGMPKYNIYEEPRTKFDSRLSLEVTTRNTVIIANTESIYSATANFGAPKNALLKIRRIPGSYVFDTNGVQVYFIDHTVDRKDRAQLDRLMLSQGYHDGIGEPNPIYDTYEDYDDDDQPICCDLCGKQLLGKRSEHYD